MFKTITTEELVTATGGSMWTDLINGTRIGPTIFNPPRPNPPWQLPEPSPTFPRPDDPLRNPFPGLPGFPQNPKHQL